MSIEACDLPPAPYQDMEDFYLRCSTKEMACVLLIWHHQLLVNNQANAVEFLDCATGNMMISDKETEQPILQDNRPTQFVIYCEFLSHIPQIASVSC